MHAQANQEYGALIKAVGFLSELEHSKLNSLFHFSDVSATHTKNWTRKNKLQ